MFDRLFLHHPRDVGESYPEHAAAAGRFGLSLVGAGFACLCHAAVPALFARTASDTVRRLHARLSTRGASARRAPAAPASDTPFVYTI